MRIKIAKAAESRVLSIVVSNSLSVSNLGEEYAAFVMSQRVSFHTLLILAHSFQLPGRKNK